MGGISEYFRKGKKFLVDKDYRFVVLGNKGFYKSMPDDEYLRRRFRAIKKTELNLDDPIGFNQKINWLKLYYRNPIYTMLVDKYEVKEWVSKKIGNEHIIKTLGIYNTFDEINFESLPNQFVIKCTHDSGSIIICKDKDHLDLSACKKRINRCLKTNLYYSAREWAYKDVQPRIIVEELLDEAGECLNDYKVFCFNGRPEMIQVDFDRFSNHGRNLYTTNWEYINAAIQYPTRKEKIIPKPKELDSLLKFAEILSAGFPFVRTDFYITTKGIYFGEMTFYHEAGTGKFEPVEFDLELGKKLMLPSKSI